MSGLVAAAHAAYVESTLTPYDRGAILDRAAAIVERPGGDPQTS